MKKCLQFLRAVLSKEPGCGQPCEAEDACDNKPSVPYQPNYDEEQKDECPRRREHQEPREQYAGSAFDAPQVSGSPFLKRNQLPA